MGALIRCLNRIGKRCYPANSSSLDDILSWLLRPVTRNFVIEQLEQHFAITAKSMFGGVGLYGDGYYFALMADDRLYFKVDASNRPDYEAEGMGPFRPYDDERSMSYYEVPIHILEDASSLQQWAGKAIAVSQRAKKRK